MPSGGQLFLNTGQRGIDHAADIKFITAGADGAGNSIISSRAAFVSFRTPGIAVFSPKCIKIGVSMNASL